MKFLLLKNEVNKNREKMSISKSYSLNLSIMKNYDNKINENKSPFSIA